MTGILAGEEDSCRAYRYTPYGEQIAAEGRQEADAQKAYDSLKNGNQADVKKLNAALLKACSALIGEDKERTIEEAVKQGIAAGDFSLLTDSKWEEIYDADTLYAIRKQLSEYYYEHPQERDEIWDKYYQPLTLEQGAQLALLALTIAGNAQMVIGAVEVLYAVIDAAAAAGAAGAGLSVSGSGAAALAVSIDLTAVAEAAQGLILGAFMQEAGKKGSSQIVHKGNSEGPLKGKAADKAAEKLEFKKTNYKSHGQPVYKKGNRYITPDIDGHNGGVWKMADSVKNLGSKATRMGTYDADLVRIGD